MMNFLHRKLSHWNHSDGNSWSLLYDVKAQLHPPCLGFRPKKLVKLWCNEKHAVIMSTRVFVPTTFSWRSLGGSQII
ncbi:hypothetical protein OPV22_011552 [Ensete ventricosum]|uniref:Uncharacterized protein n=1 Tax=Ensete ventricosum TaxID=4639 RepID=A0AAV8RFY7_ENSVE|nr:hypothetical protein OPV22_011552 [Ensete ventricosum]